MRDSSPWIELHSGVREHHKITMLSEILKIEYAHAVGLMACLWSSPYAMTHEGCFNGCTNAFLKKVALWNGDANIFVDALKKSKLLDSSNIIHDYDLHGQRLLISSRNRMKRFRNVSVTHRTERKRERKKEGKKGKEGGLGETEFLNAIKQNPAYQHIDVDNELSKMDAWISTRPGRQKTKRFVVNWLNNIEKPLSTANNIPPRKYTEAQIQTAASFKRLEEKLRANPDPKKIS